MFFLYIFVNANMRQKIYICSKLEEIFNSVYDKNSTITAKRISKSERDSDSNKGKDLSYVYSEVVSNIK